ncbi:MAG: polynucleotide adenylyltransferase [Vezdaea aestivalis]|nr:MAG: polynucleotide adenylyltransferase [Vezdaea aestivalis]
MAGQLTQRYGITDALSLNAPTEKEIAANDDLIEELKRQKNFESAEETQKRIEVLSSLQKIAEEFVRRASRANSKPESVVASSGGKVVPYGSFRLGVFGPGSDIDTLVVVPNHISRENFFELFPDLLVDMAPKDSIEDLTPVPDAFVPIIKFSYSGIDIDLIFARLAISQVPEDIDLKNNDLLRGVEERDLRSLNGTRVTDEILALVPQVKVFRNALRAVKLWAQRKAVYANVYGFPGGVAWAMLVARICQLYPRATSSTIVIKFFKIYTTWRWPQPVMLKTIEAGVLNARVWNPMIYQSDRQHLVPVITPAWPSMCATHNITLSTKKVMLAEMSRAGNLVNAIFDGKAQWRDLFKRHCFFVSGYKYYLVIVSASKTKEAQLKWSGLVESKVRTLVNGLENSESIDLAHPYVKGFDRKHRCSGEDDIDKVKNGDTTFEIKDEEDMADAKGETVYTTSFYIGIELVPEKTKSLDISYETRDFKMRCAQWDQYDEDLMSLNVIHQRNYDLPLDVFEAGEERPTRVKGKKVKATTATKKRNVREAELEAPPSLINKRQNSSNGVPTV